MSFEFFEGKDVMVTGGTGSFGQECVKTLLEKTKTRRVIVFSRDELKQEQMRAEISDPEKRLRFFIGDIRDSGRLKRAFNGVDYVIHAAALKQVPALEYNPFEAVNTNILGTKNIIDAAIDCGVKKVVLVSTDKAANPANLYGATKLCAERLMISGNSYSGGKTKLGVVRYGNVFGSRGSLVQLLKKQQKGGEVTLTHEEMTRFWITLPEGVAFVLMALKKLQGGEVFIPKIPSMAVKELIKVLAPDCEIKIIGIRPGEKLHEILVTPEEARHTKEFESFYVIFPEFDWWNDIDCYKGGEDLPSDFQLSSHTSLNKLEESSLKKLLDLL